MKLIKKTVVLLLAAALLFAFCACDKGGNDTPTDKTEAPAEATDAPSDNFADKLVIDINGAKVKVGSTEKEFLAALDGVGIEYTINQAVSCMFSGFDDTITFDGGSAFTFPLTEGGENTVDEISIDAVGPTVSGIGVESTLEDIVAAFGDGYFMDGEGTYVYNASGYAAQKDQSGVTKIYFYLEDNAVVYFGVCANLYHTAG